MMAVDPIYRSAQELARRLQSLADDLSLLRPPTRSWKGSSPRGYVLGPKEMLLPDGRLWRSSSASGSPGDGFYDVGTQYERYTSTRLPVNGETFLFLGVALGDYTFGFVEERISQADNLSGLCAIYSGGSAICLVTADEAFAALGRQAGR